MKTPVGFCRMQVCFTENAVVGLLLGKVFLPHISKHLKRLPEIFLVRQVWGTMALL